ncbi:MAG: hypothetical protein HGA45_31315, partial [Chloroflexales bacterium]|nr:hypothetical protein [Chloroflexales bacterium]
MSDLAPGFQSLPLEYQRVIFLAQDRHNMTITPLQQLIGGWSGAVIFLVSVSSHTSKRVEHFILKLNRRNKSSQADEVTRHTIALSKSPPDFTRDHIAAMAFDRVEHDDTIAIFYRIAGQSLRDYRSLASYGRQSQLKTIFAATNTLLLAEWNVNLAFEQAVHPQRLLEKWLGFRLKPGGNIDSFLDRVCQMHPHIPGFLISGDVFRNPLAYARNIDCWGTTRPIDIVTGFLHGDLNTGNILIKFSDNAEVLDGYYLIDFALFKEQMPLFYDQRYLEMSYLLLAMARVSFATCVALITRLAEADILDPHQAPIEMAGACAVIGSARSVFATWVSENHPSLHDDLWGQYWLAGVAVGLSYCHKPGPSDEQRLAGLIYAAANLKRYAALFALPTPAEVKQLYDERQFNAAPRARFVTGSSAPDVRHNLPAQPTALIGREQERAAIDALLGRADIRLITLTGPGGTGKTRLALQAATELLDTFTDGVWFVDLAPISDSDLVIPTIMQTLGMKAQGQVTPLEQLRAHLRDKQLLLVLDNFEQVVEAAPRVAELLAAAPQLKMLITSRVVLHVRGEQEFPVPPLALPDQLQLLPLETVSQYAAVALFIARAQAVKPDFAITNQNAPAVAEICVRLDGLPLAIELAAARIKLFVPEALLKRLEWRLGVLIGGPRDAPERQQTIRNTIDWSYQLLDEGEQTLFRRLGVFVGGCTLEAAEAACNADGRLPFVVIEGVAALVDKSLLRQEEGPDGESRFVMLETIRAYALERLAESGELEAARQQHGRYYASTIIHEAGVKVYSSEATIWLDWFERELDNIRATLAWSQTTPEGGALGPSEG